MVMRICNHVLGRKYAKDVKRRLWHAFSKQGTVYHAVLGVSRTPEGAVYEPGFGGTGSRGEDLSGPAHQRNLFSASIRPVVAVKKRRRYAAGEIPKARAK